MSGLDPSPSRSPSSHHRPHGRPIQTIVTALVLATAVFSGTPAPVGAQAAAKQPNIIFIMGDDVGWFNIGAYHQPARDYPG